MGIQGWTNQCKALLDGRSAPSDGQPSVLDAARVLAGDEATLQRYSRHGLDLMLARLLFVDPQCSGGRSTLCSQPAAAAVAPETWAPQLVCCEGQSGHDAALEQAVIDLVFDAIDDDDNCAATEPGGPSGTRRKLHALQLFTRRHLVDAPVLSSWLMAHLSDILEQALSHLGKQLNGLAGFGIPDCGAAQQHCTRRCYLAA